ncbi:hypothetical protein DFH06DRAFT_1467364 [Mycena polygramma]|nr:hypothetical protein DFH06DRAFT_1467364 [Mycena polygramma]
MSDCWNCGVPTDSGVGTAPPIPPPISSAIQHLLKSNDPPADSEVHTIKHYIAHGRLRLDAANTQLEILRATMDRLTSERDALAQRLQPYIAAVSPIRRMPAELICEIFSWTLSCTNKPGGSTDPAPWYLGHISRTWREIAVNLPSLWNSIAFCKDGTVFPLSMVQTQLIWSANAPLHVELKLVDVPDEYAAAPFIAALLPHSNRWESLILVCSEPGRPLLELLRPVKGQLSQLSTLEIVDHGTENDTTAFDIFCISPRLRVVLLTSPPLYCFSPPLLIPWEQITRYRGTTAYNLVDCSVGVTDWNGEEAIEEVVGHIGELIISLPHLRRLYTEQSELLTFLTASNLEELSCQISDSLLSFVQRSSCRLITLVLTALGVSFTPPAEDIISLLQNTPLLRNLVLPTSSSSEDNNRVLSAMTITGSSGDVCPELAYIAYGSPVRKVRFSRDVLYTMVQSRLHPERRFRLRSLRLLSAPSSLTADLVRILKNEGFDASIGDASSFVHEARYSFVLA